MKFSYRKHDIKITFYSHFHNLYAVIVPGNFTLNTRGSLVNTAVVFKPTAAPGRHEWTQEKGELRHSGASPHPSTSAGTLCDASGYNRAL